MLHGQRVLDFLNKFEKQKHKAYAELEKVDNVVIDQITFDNVSSSINEKASCTGKFRHCIYIFVHLTKI